MFDDTVYDYDTLHTRMREQAFLNGGLYISTEDKREGKEQKDEMCYAGGIREFVSFINHNKTPLHNEVIYMKGERSDSEAEIALQYNDSYNEVIVSFANNIHTPEGGMHETGFQHGAHASIERLRHQGRHSEERRQALRRGLPRGHDRDHLRQAHRAAVRGPDQGKARQQPRCEPW